MTSRACPPDAYLRDLKSLSPRGIPPRPQEPVPPMHTSGLGPVISATRNRACPSDASSNSTRMSPVLPATETVPRSIPPQTRACPSDAYLRNRACPPGASHGLEPVPPGASLLRSTSSQDYLASLAKSRIPNSLSPKDVPTSATNLSAFLSPVRTEHGHRRLARFGRFDRIS